MRFEFSAGGIVFKKEGGLIQILVSQHSQHHGWVFPKGIIGDKEKSESKETTALREVKEETGVEGKILKPIKPVEYWYVMEGEKIKKTVYYFLMEYIGGSIEDHDNEMENVEWLPMDAVEARLTYKADKEAWQEALNLIK